MRDPGGLEGDVVGEAAVMRSSCRDRELAAELVLALPQRHVVAALGRQRRDLEARRAATDDEHPTWGGRFDGRELVAGLRIDRAREAHAVDQRAMQAVVDAHTRPQRLAGAGLARQVGVGDHRPRDPDDVGGAVGHDPLREARVRDPARVGDRDRDRRAQLARHPDPVGGVVLHRLHVARRAPVVADVDVEVVDDTVEPPRVLERLGRSCSRPRSARPGTAARRRSSRRSRRGPRPAPRAGTSCGPGRRRPRAGSRAARGRTAAGRRGWHAVRCRRARPRAPAPPTTRTRRRSRRSRRRSTGAARPGRRSPRARPRRRAGARPG